MPQSARAFWNTTFVFFRNDHPTTVSVAILRQSDACASEGGYEAVGWYVVAPGQTRYLFSTEARYAGYYAEAQDGAKWSGPYGTTIVDNNAFAHCPLGSTDPSAKRIGFRLIDTAGTTKYTIGIS
jgi:uncharacterized membrane protein